MSEPARGASFELEKRTQRNLCLHKIKGVMEISLFVEI